MVEGIEQLGSRRDRAAELVDRLLVVSAALVLADLALLSPVVKGVRDNDEMARRGVNQCLGERRRDLHHRGGEADGDTVIVAVWIDLPRRHSDADFATVEKVTHGPDDLLTRQPERTQFAERRCEHARRCEHTATLLSVLLIRASATLVEWAGWRASLVHRWCAAAPASGALVVGSGHRSTPGEAWNARSRSTIAPERAPLREYTARRRPPPAGGSLAKLSPRAPTNRCKIS